MHVTITPEFRATYTAEARAHWCTACGAQPFEPCVYVEFAERLGEPMTPHVHAARLEQVYLSQAASEIVP